MIWLFFKRKYKKKLIWGVLCVQRVATVKVDSYDYNYDDVEKGVQEALL